MNRDTVTIRGWEIEPMPQPDLYYALNARSIRAEFVRLRISGDTATAHGEGHGHTYRLARRAGRWHCTCPAGQAGRACYHTAVAEAADKLDGERRARAEADRIARIVAYENDRADSQGYRCDW